MQEYGGSPTEDVLLVQWWNQMVRDGELDSTLGPRYLALGTFFAAFRQPAQLLYATDGPLGIVTAVWIDPSPLSGAFVGLWIHPAWRRQRKAADAVFALLAAALARYPVLIFATEREAVEKLHRHVGAVFLGEVPHLYGGETARISYLTPEAFQKTTARFRRAA